MNNVKFVSPEYIDNCFGQKTKLGMKKYSLKAADALYFVWIIDRYIVNFINYLASDISQ